MRNCCILLALVFLLALGCAARSARRAAAGDSLAVAPVFVHGDGLGKVGGIAGFGCGFLFEDSGRMLIESELARAGFTFQLDGLTLDSVRLPLTGFVGNNPGAWGSKDTSTTWWGSLTFDGYDSAHHFAYEYVSTEDYSSWAVRDSEVQIYDAMVTINTRGGAQKLRDGIIHAAPKVTVALFYDPILTPEQATKRKGIPPAEPRRIGLEELNALVPQVSAPLLREQVRDFLRWYAKHKP